MTSSAPIMFGKFTVTHSVFYTTRLSFALVNLKPLLPGHVLVCPRRIAPRLTDLTTEEVTDVYLTVQRVARMLERVFNVAALNIATQDGYAAGQSVPHLHVHLIPRKDHDLDAQGGGDAIYGMLEAEGGNVGRHWAERELELWERPRVKMGKVDEESRRERTDGELREEARWLVGEMEKEVEKEKL